MITVPQIDRLVVSDDAIAARLWPRLGARVRQAYTTDRDAWVVLRRKVDAGETVPAPTLAAEHKVFSGWARAFRAASSRPKREPSPSTLRPAVSPAAAAAAIAVTPSVAPAASPLAATALPSLPTVPKPTGGAGTAVAGGLVLAGLIAVAARRKST